MTDDALDVGDQPLSVTDSEQLHLAGLEPAEPGPYSRLNDLEALIQRAYRARKAAETDA